MARDHERKKCKMSLKLCAIHKLSNMHAMHYPHISNACAINTHQNNKSKFKEIVRHKQIWYFRTKRDIK